ncbi:hypothetical protein XELAEV_18027672mg, partial [Xenopus laevis]
HKLYLSLLRVQYHFRTEVTSSQCARIERISYDASYLRACLRAPTKNMAARIRLLYRFRNKPKGSLVPPNKPGVSRSMSEPQGDWSINSDFKVEPPVNQPNNL